VLVQKSAQINTKPPFYNLNALFLALTFSTKKDARAKF
jgi:hypothetical protein